MAIFTASASSGQEEYQYYVPCTQQQQQSVRTRYQLVYLSLLQRCHKTEAVMHAAFSIYTEQDGGKTNGPSASQASYIGSSRKFHARRDVNTASLLILILPIFPVSLSHTQQRSLLLLLLLPLLMLLVQLLPPQLLLLLLILLLFAIFQATRNRQQEEKKYSDRC